MDPTVNSRISRAESSQSAAAPSTPEAKAPESKNDAPVRGVLSMNPSELVRFVNEHSQAASAIHSPHHRGHHHEASAISSSLTANAASLPEQHSHIDQKTSVSSSVLASAHDRTPETVPVTASTAAVSTAPAQNASSITEPNKALLDVLRQIASSEPGATIPSALQQKAAAMLCELDPNHTSISGDPRVRDIRVGQLDRCKDYQIVSAEAGKLQESIDALRKNLGQHHPEAHAADGLGKLKAELLQHLEKYQRYEQGLHLTKGGLATSIQHLNEGMSLERIAHNFESRQFPEKAQEFFNKAHASLVLASEQLRNNPLAELLPGTTSAQALSGLQGQGKPLNQVLSPELATALAATAVVTSLHPAHSVHSAPHWLHATAVGSVSPGVLNGIAAVNSLAAAPMSSADRVIDSTSRIFPSKVEALASGDALHKGFSSTDAPTSIYARAISASTLHSTINERIAQSNTSSEQSAQASHHANHRRQQLAIQQSNRRIAATAAVTRETAKAAKKSVLDIMNARASKNKVFTGALSGALIAVGTVAALSAPAFTATALINSTLTLFGASVGGVVGGSSGFSLGGATIALLGGLLGGLLGAAAGSQIKVHNTRSRSGR